MEAWRERILRAVDDDPRSDRAISLAANLGVNFVNELRKSEKEAGVNKLIRLAETLGVSLGYVFSGTEISAQAEADLHLFLSLRPESRRAILNLAHQLVAGELGE